MVNSKTDPCGTSSCTDISGVGLYVGPIIKFPSAFAGAFVPSGTSLAVTYPDVWGSRVGGVGRAAVDCACTPPRLIKIAILKKRNIDSSVLHDFSEYPAPWFVAAPFGPVCQREEQQLSMMGL